MGRSWAGIVVAATAIAGCGDNGAPLLVAGTYLAEADVHEKPCGVQVDPTDTSDPFFVPMTGWTFDVVWYADQAFPFYYSCWAHTTGPCSALTATALETPRLHGWDRTLFEASRSDVSGECTLAYGVVSLTQEDDDRMIVDVIWHKQIGVPTETCTEAEAAARAASMPCYKHEHVEGTLVIDPSPSP